VSVVSCFVVFGAVGSITDTKKLVSDLESFSDEHGVVVQVVDADLVCGSIHLCSAVEHAVRASVEERMATRSLAMEVLLYASGERQIQYALPKMGVKVGDSVGIGGVVIGRKDQDQKELEALVSDLVGCFGWVRDEKVLVGDSDCLIRFGISEVELETMPKDKYEDLILEKVALVDILKK